MDDANKQDSSGDGNKASEDPKEIKIQVTHHDDSDSGSDETTPTKKPESTDDQVAEQEVADEAKQDEDDKAEEVAAAGAAASTVKEDAENTDNIVSEDAETEQPAEDVEKNSEEPTQENTETEPVAKDAKEEVDPNQTVEEAVAAQSAKEESKTDSEIDQAVDDIVKNEGDEVLADSDAKLAAASSPAVKKSFPSKVKGWFLAWWNNKPARYGTFAVLGALFLLVVLYPPARYTALNTVGVRASSSMTVVDSQTRLPLKNISVELQDQSAVTDEEGYAAFSELKLGGSELVITKRGYADTRENITVGWGSNPIGEQPLVATGEQFTFVLSDWQSGNPINEAEASSGENSAVADDSGKIVLTVGEDNIANVKVVITAEGYHDQEMPSDQLADGDIPVKLVPAKKHTFVSNRSGKYDLYKIDIDGQNEEILFGATDKEREVPSVIPHPTRDLVAYVSSRDGDTNSDGFVLDGLYIIDVITGDSDRIARSEQLQVIGWSDDTLVFWQVVEGTSAGNPQRSKLVSYNERTKERVELATANYFNDVELVGDKVYFAVSSFAVPQSQAKLYRVNVTGDNSTKVVDAQVWNIFRSGYDTLIFSAENQKWYQETESGSEEIARQTAPATRRYKDAPNGERTAWVEIRDGKGVLLVSSTDDFDEQQILSLPGLNEVLYWSNNDTVIFRVISNEETADYLINLDKGEAVKIVDVTATRNAYF